VLVKELLESNLVTVAPTDTLSKAWEVLREHGVTGAVVVTEEGRLVGVVTDGDFIRACMPSETDIAIYDEIMEKMELPDAFLRYIRAMRVEDIMQPEDQVITIGHNEPIIKALALMFQHRLRRIPVLENNQLIGTISRAQILQELLITRDVS